MKFIVLMLFVVVVCLFGKLKVVLANLAIKAWSALLIPESHHKVYPGTNGHLYCTAVLFRRLEHIRL